MKCKNIKDIYTDILGGIIMTATLYAVFTGKMQWQWEGVISMVIGFVFFWIPDDVIAKYLKKKADITLDNEKQDGTKTDH